MSDALARLQQYRDLVLACEITGFIHDLDKLSPWFAEEKLKAEQKFFTRKQREDAINNTNIREPHGAILENGRLYPFQDECPPGSDFDNVLKSLLKNPAWATLMVLPEDWQQQPLVQVEGLGAPLRQHHAKGFLQDNHSFLGDLYTFGADVRDSALDKGSGSIKGEDESKGIDAQQTGKGFIANSFGIDVLPYGPEQLSEWWGQLPAVLNACLLDKQAYPWKDPQQSRKNLYLQMDRLFRHALGETRRPTNDVTLWHHAYSSASHFKSAVAECVLRADVRRLQCSQGADAGHLDIEKMGLIRFRLLGVRWNWRELTRGALTPVVLTSLALARQEAIGQLRQLLEEDYPLGNLLYEDDDGALFILPGFYEGETPENQDASKALFRKLLELLTGRISDCVLKLGEGTPFRLCWSEPTLYLTDYPEALGLVSGGEQMYLQAGEKDLRELWQHAATNQSWQICPQCGMRPALAGAQESNQRKGQVLCETCQDLSDSAAKRERHQKAANLFGYKPKTFEVESLTEATANSRVLLVSVQMDMDAIASGNAMITQLARPLTSILDRQMTSANALGDWFQTLLKAIHDKNRAILDCYNKIENQRGKWVDSPDKEKLANWLGDKYWLGAEDGRSTAQDVVERAGEIAQGFFLRQTRYLPEEWGLYRHDGDRLALFAQRKHPSPARLQRLWDDLRALWRELLCEVGGIAEGQLVPLSLDARGLRFLVSAADGTAVINQMQTLLTQTFGKLRGGLAPHVSCLAFGKKFPLYIALDAVYRMEARIPKTPHQSWVLKEKREVNPKVYSLHWQTPQGLVVWEMDMSTGDPDKPDLWHPHLIRSRLADGTEVQGPDRLTHVQYLQPGDQCLIPPATFDFLALETGARRYQIVYEQQGRQLHRPHLVFGDLGKPVGLLEQFNDMASLLGRTGWNSSQLKALHGEMVELYEKWVRDVPETLRDNGRKAWETHLRAMLNRYLPDKGQSPERDAVLEAVINGRFFDAVEWGSFITGDFEKSKANSRYIKQKEVPCA